MSAGWVVGGFAFTALCLPTTDVRALLPVVTQSASWIVEGSTFIEPRAGLKVLQDGSFEVGNLHTTALILGPERSAPLFAFGPMVLLIPPWITAPISLKARLVAFLLGGGSTLVLLHLVAAGGAGAAWLVVPSVPLAAQSLWGHIAPRW